MSGFPNLGKSKKRFQASLEFQTRVIVMSIKYKERYSSLFILSNE